MYIEMVTLIRYSDHIRCHIEKDDYYECKDYIFDDSYDSEGNYIKALEFILNKTKKAEEY